MLKERLKNRMTETEESLNKRVEKAILEMEHQGEFDAILVNEELEKVLMEASDLVENFI